ncbi:MAG: hypothetical protein AAFQ68_08960 [Bacteroidota bacterium]
MTQLKNFVLLLMLAFAVVACDPQNVTGETLAESEVAEILDAELQEVAGGVTTEVENIAAAIVEVISTGQLCDTLIEDSTAFDHQSQRLQTEYQSDYSFFLSCNSFNLPSSADFTSEASFLLTTNRLELDNTSTFTGNATGINSGPFQIALDTIVINGDYDKTGMQEFLGPNPKTVNSTFTSDLADFKVGISSQQIEAGLLTFTYAGSTQQGNFSYSGNILFLGNKTATLTIDGTDYPIDWN